MSEKKLKVHSETSFGSFLNGRLFGFLRHRILRFVREICSFEFIGLSTVLMPPLLASMGFFVGRTVTPWYFYVVTIVLLTVSFSVDWRRGLAYLFLLLGCSFLTAFTFSYVGTDAQLYHFPMQYLLRHGWNPVFDSTVEKFTAIAGDARLAIYHTLFLPKFSALCGAIVASSLGLFSGDGFLGYVLIVCLFSTSVKFARRYWFAKGFWCVVFASGLAFSTKITSFLAGQVDYSTYASFCIASMALVLYIRERRLVDLSLFFVSSGICMASKSTGVLCCFVLVVLTLPFVYRRIEYWRALILLCVVVAIIGASPLLTAWVQYGSPFYPSMTFDPRVAVVDITSDFTGNPDALSMGYLSRISYAWISPKVTVFVLRLLRNDPTFNPVFTVCEGVAGLGMWFNILLFVSVVLLAISRKNLVACLCIVFFVSSNFAPLKYIGYSRYFPQIWAIFPLSVMNFVCTFKFENSGRRWVMWMKTGVVWSLGFLLVGLSTLSLMRSVAYQGRMMVLEKIRQNLIASFPLDKPVKVSGWNYRFTNVARFKQAGVRLVKSEDGKVDTIMQKDLALPCYDTQPEVYTDFNRRFPICKSVRAMVMDFKWLDVAKSIPHVLWDREELNR